MKTLFGILVLVPTLVCAQDIRIRSGGLDFESVLAGGSVVQIVGNQGFLFEGHAENAFLEATDCYYGCDPGEIVSVGLHVNGNDLPGIVEFDGMEFDDVGGPISPNQMGIEVVGHAMVPRMRGLETRTQTVQGSFIGTFIHAGAIESLRCPTNVILTWQRGEGVWFLDRVRYNLRRDH